MFQEAIFVNWCYVQQVAHEEHVRGMSPEWRLKWFRTKREMHMLNERRWMALIMGAMSIRSYTTLIFVQDVNGIRIRDTQLLNSQLTCLGSNLCRSQELLTSEPFILKPVQVSSSYDIRFITMRKRGWKRATLFLYHMSVAIRQARSSQSVTDRGF